MLLLQRLTQSSRIAAAGMLPDRRYTGQSRSCDVADELEEDRASAHATEWQMQQQLAQSERIGLEDLASENKANPANAEVCSHLLRSESRQAL
jgi:hypothetical protein